MPPWLGKPNLWCGIWRVALGALVWLILNYVFWQSEFQWSKVNLLWEEMLSYEARHPLRAKLSHRTTLLGTLEIQFDMFWGLDFSFSFFLRWKGLNSNFYSLLLLMYFGSFGSQNCFSSHKHMLFFFGPSRAAVGGRRDKFPNHTSARVWTPGSKQRWKLLLHKGSLILYNNLTWIYSYQ